MIELYIIWIRTNYPTPQSAARQCFKATEDMSKNFTDLKRVRGHVFVAQNQRVEEHWWCEDWDGCIVDPTRHQWHGPVYDYIEFDGEKPIGKCYRCGKYIYKSSCKNEFFCKDHQHLDISIKLKNSSI